jgi:hypothetical protein
VIGIEKAAGVLGLSTRQVYRRISAARPVVSPYLRRGENNALLLDGSAIEILRAIEDYRKTGITVEEAVELIAGEVGGKHQETHKGNGGKPSENGGSGINDLSEPWKLLIAEKDCRISDLEGNVIRLEKDRDHWRELADDYRRQLAPPPQKVTQKAGWRILRIFRRIRG